MSDLSLDAQVHSLIDSSPSARELGDTVNTLIYGKPQTDTERWMDEQIASGWLPEAARQDEAYRNYIDASDNPLEAVARLNGAKFFADSMGTDFQTALRDYDAIAEAWYGANQSPISNWEAIKFSFQSGMQSMELGNLWAKKRDGGLSPEEEDRLADLEDSMPPADQIKRSLPVETLKLAASSIPYSVSGAVGSGIGGAVAQGLASLVFPEGALAIATIAAIGRTAGSMAANLGSMSGLEYRDMIKAGVNQNVAKVSSLISGGLQSAIESDQIMGLLPTEGAKKSLAGAVKKVVGEGLLKGKWRNPIITAALRQGSRMASEGFEEALQQVVSESAFEIARQASNSEGGKQVDPHTWDEVGKAIVDNFVGGALASLPLGALGEPWAVAQDVSEYATWKKAKAAEKEAKAQVEKGETPASSAADSLPAGATAPDKAWRDKESGRIYAEFAETGEHLNDDGEAVIESRLKIGDPDAKTTYAFIDHHLETDAAGTQTVVVDHVDFNRPEAAASTAATEGKKSYFDEAGEGSQPMAEDLPAAMRPIFKDAFTELAAHYPGAKVEWQAVTPEELALKDEIERESPTKNLQWFYPDRPAAEQLSRTELRRQIIATFRDDRSIADEADGILAIADRLAAKKGVSTDSMLASVFEGQAISRSGVPALNKSGTSDAGVFFRDAQGAAAKDVFALSREDLGKFKAVVKLAESADFTAFSHEFFHAMERLWFDQDEVKAFEQSLGKRRASWGRSDLEYLADQWEHYLSTGDAPAEELKPIFSRLAAALKSFVQEFVGLKRRYGSRYELSPELKAAYDNLLADPASGLSLAEGEPSKEGQGEEGKTENGKSNATHGEDAKAVRPAPHEALEVDAGLYHTREDEEFASKIDDYQHGALPSHEVVNVSMPRGVLASFLPQRELVIRQATLRKAVEKHSIDLAELRTLPSNLEHPIFILSGNRPGTLTVLTEAHDQEGRNVLAAIEIGRTLTPQPETRIEVSKIASLHGKDAEKLLYWIEGGRLLWADKEKGPGWVATLPRSNSERVGPMQDLYKKIYAEIEAKSSDSPALLHSRPDLAREAADFDSPEEYRDYVESLFADADDDRATQDLSEEEKAAFYRELWEEGRAAAEREAQEIDAVAQGDPNEAFIERMAAPGGVEGFLESLWGAGTYLAQGEHSGFVDESEILEAERLDDVARRAEKEMHPTIKSAMISVGKNGRALSESRREAILSLMRHGALDYRLIDAELRGDDGAVAEIKEKLNDRVQRFGSLPDPDGVKKEGLTIAGRARLERAFEDEEIKRKIRTGDFTDAEIKQLVSDLDAEKGAAVKERDTLRSELKDLEGKLDDRENDWIDSNKQLMAARKEIERADTKIQRLAKRAGYDPSELKTALAERETLAGRLDVLEKAFNRKTRALRDQDKVNAIAARQAAVEKAVAHVQAIAQRKKAAIELREEKIRLSSDIMAERSLKRVNHEEWTAIRAIQGLIDPNFRRATLKWRGEIIDLAKLREDPDRLNDLGLEAALARRLAKKPLNEWTIAELEGLKKQVDGLETLGQAKLAAKKAEDKAKATMIGNGILATVEHDHNYEDAHSYSSAELADQLKKKDRKNFALLTAFDMDRVATYFDGGNPGRFHEILVDRVRAAQNREQVEKERREKAIVDVLTRHKMDLGDLKRKDIAIDLGRLDPDSGESRVEHYSKEDLMFAMLALRDYGGAKPDAWLGSRGAYIFGNFFNADLLLRKNDSGEYVLGDEALKNLGSRVEAAVLKAIRENLKAPELELAEAMEADWNTEFDRLRQAMIDNYNQELAQVRHYVPLRRQGADFSSLEAEMLENQKTLAGLTTNPDKGMTIERTKIGARHQLPVRTDLLNLYFDSVRKQEHLIAFADYFKTANRVFKQGDIARELRQKIRLTWGDGALKYIGNYLSELANPSDFKSLSNAEKAFRFLRGNQGVAYLGLRLGSVCKQVLTSPIPFITYSNPVFFAKASYEAMSDPLNFQKRIESMSPYLRSRQASPVLEALRSGGDPKAIEEIKKAQALMMKPLEWADRSTVAIGWYAVYMKSKADGLSEEAARAFADDVTHKTQPSVNSADLAPLFKEGGEFAKVFTQFQMPMNRIFQQVFFDLPNAVKNKEYARAVGIICSYALSGLALMLVAGPRGDDDDKKRRDWIFSAFSQFTDSVPFIGGLATDLTRTALTGDREQQFSTSLLPAAEKSLGGTTVMLDALWDQNTEKLGKGMLTALEGAGIGVGLPTQTIKDLTHIPDAGLGALLGRRSK
jgi:hypothetical protein